MAAEKEYVNITPTPEACRMYKQIFLEGQEKARNKIKLAENLLHTDLIAGEIGIVLYEALEIGVEHIIAEEKKRIINLQEGIDELERCGY